MSTKIVNNWINGVDSPPVDGKYMNVESPLDGKNKN